MTHMPSDDPVRRALEIVCRHQRRSGTERCGRCGGVWQTRHADRPFGGCASRLLAVEHLIAAGHLRFDGLVCSFPAATGTTAWTSPRSAVAGMAGGHS